jgi:putative salt-induced outer membrane protein
MRHPLIGLALLLPVPLAAQDSVPPPPKPWALTADLGYVKTGGNADLQTLNAGDKLTYDPGSPWRFTQTFLWVYSQSDEESEANQMGGELRADYDFTDRISAYGFGGFFRDPFAGISRRFTEGLGVGYKPILAPRDTLTLEAGMSFVQERNVLDVEREYAAGRLAGFYKHVLREGAWFTLGGQVLPNLDDSDDLRADAEAALVAPLSTHFAVKVGYLVRYDGQPEPGFEETDTIFTTGLQINY